MLNPHWQLCKYGPHLKEDDITIVAISFLQGISIGHVLQVSSYHTQMQGAKLQNIIGFSFQKASSKIGFL